MSSLPVEPRPIAAAVDSTMPRGLADGAAEAVDAAFGQLRRGVPPALLLELVKGLVARRLPRVAASLLHSVGAPLMGEPGVVELATRLAMLPTRLMPREAQRTNAARSIAALRRQGTSIPRAAIERLRDDGIEVHVDRDGIAHGLVCVDGARSFAGPARWALTASERELVAKAWPPVVVLAGLPPAHLLRALLEVDNGSEFRPVFVAFESDAASIAAWLRANDVSDACMSGRLRVHLGSDAIERHLDARRGTLALAVPAVAIVLRPECPLARACLDLPDRCAELWRRERERLTAAAVARVAVRPRGDLRSRFEAARSGEGALRVAGIVSSHTKVVRGMMRDLLGAFAARGHTTRLVTEADEAMPSVDTVTPFVGADVDLVLAINYLRRHPSSFIPVELPFVSWMQDGVGFAMTAEAGAKQGATDVLVAASPGYWESNFGYPRGQSITAANLTSWSLYGTIGDCGRRPGAPDVVYVGHGWEPAEMVADARAESESAKRIVGDMLAEYRRWLDRGATPTGFERLRIEARCLAVRGLEAGVSGQALYWTGQAVFDRLFRHQALEWAGRWAERRGRRFAIHGEGWERHPTLGRFAAGPVENGAALGELCRDSGAVLHVNGNSSLHQRLLDGCAAGGCVLTRRNPADEMAEHHRTLRRLHAAAPFASLAELVDRARNDEALRAAIEGIERSLGCAVRPRGDPRREIDCVTIDITGLWPADTRTDEGLLRHLVGDGGIITPEGASDIDGFAATTYGNEPELWVLLDRVTADDEERRRLSAPLRESVRRSFTMESLVDRVVERMCECLARTSP